MAAELALDIDVQISDELRALFRRTRGLAPEPAAAPVSKALAPEVLAPDPGWHRIALRQDGARPLIFEGLALYALREAVEDLPGRAELHLSLYLSRGQVLHAALAVLPPETLAARPIHRAAALAEPSAFARFLRDFAPETCLETIHATSPEARAQHDSARQALRSAFTSMAARCVTPELRLA